MTARKSKTPAWEISRAALNHDWLKNRFVVRTNSLLARLNAASENAQPVHEYLDEVLSQWPVKRAELTVLLTRFERDMSPRKIVEGWVRRSEAPGWYAWLAEAVHLLWLRRCGVDRMKTAAVCAVEDLEGAYQAVSRWCDPAERGPGILVRMRDDVELFVRLRDAGIELSETLSRFPHEVQVV